MPCKGKQCTIPIDMLINRKSLCGGGEKISTFPKQKAL